MNVATRVAVVHREILDALADDRGVHRSDIVRAAIEAGAFVLYGARLGPEPWITVRRAGWVRHDDLAPLLVDPFDAAHHRLGIPVATPLVPSPPRARRVDVEPIEQPDEPTPAPAIGTPPDPRTVPDDFTPHFSPHASARSVDPRRSWAIGLVGAVGVSAVVGSVIVGSAGVGVALALVGATAGLVVALAAARL